MKKEERQQLHPQPYYIPLFLHSTKGHEVGKPRLLIVTPTVPDQACGKAHRIGRVRVQSTVFPLYRLHIAVEGRPDQAMLPDLFVLVNGCFVEYADWSATNMS